MSRSPMMSYRTGNSEAIHNLSNANLIILHRYINFIYFVLILNMIQHFEIWVYFKYDT